MTASKHDIFSEKTGTLECCGNLASLINEIVIRTGDICQ